MIIHSPLEQFEIHSLIPIHLAFLDFSFTNASLFIVLVIAVSLLLIVSAVYKSKLKPSAWQSVVELFYEFLVNLVYESVGDRGKKIIPLIFIVFTFILFCNLIGIIPYSFSVTGHLAVTFFFALSFFVGITIIGFINFRIHFFSLFFPQGTPLVIAPLLVIIEIVSYFSRPISLSVRLFANIISGHSLLKIIAGFAWSIATAGGFLALTSLVPLVILTALIGLEFTIAFLQAYVFTVLVLIYSNDAFELH